MQAVFRGFVARKIHGPALRRASNSHPSSPPHPTFSPNSPHSPQRNQPSSAALVLRDPARPSNGPSGPPAGGGAGGSGCSLCRARFFVGLLERGDAALHSGVGRGGEKREGEGDGRLPCLPRAAGLLQGGELAFLFARFPRALHPLLRALLSHPPPQLPCVPCGVHQALHPPQSALL